MHWLTFFCAGARDAMVALRGHAYNVAQRTPRSAWWRSARAKRMCWEVLRQGASWRRGLLSGLAIGWRQAGSSGAMLFQTSAPIGWRSQR